ncbi:NADH-quinone oxidoreductase subunit J [Candidatus Jidaibacter acanthamoeba]|uniref:NADH-quinone oxidoreductase subunit J n=1 Tax=Candidatus Jidaibacter acanthamoebae TaxID=86105 RepID=A0A0C1MU07_9RICK|nr:NADH-quinone oxidoreductase subunit J [Candidatus Jidaibacter acanthamoeba]KIE05577.1 NADH-quinone oxidoreductase subunit J [Candidatus Jidaibacter acanthamoeba]
MQELVFYSFAILIVLSALMVVSVKNPVHAVLFLIFAFFNASGLFILIGAEYIAMTLVIVYVGAVMVLFLFVIMMLDVDFAVLKQGFLKTMPLVVVLGVIIFAELFYAIKASDNIKFNSIPIPIPIPLLDPNIPNTQALGLRIYTEYFFAFQVSGLILLVAMIGAIVLTIRHEKRVRRQNIHTQITRKKEDTVKLVNVKVGEGVDI